MPIRRLQVSIPTSLLSSPHSDIPAAIASDSGDRDKHETQSQANDRSVEEAARALAERLRAMPNRQEMTDYAVSLLRESNEEADQAELAHESKAKALDHCPQERLTLSVYF